LNKQKSIDNDICILSLSLHPTFGRDLVTLVHDVLASWRNLPFYLDLGRRSVGSEAWLNDKPSTIQRSFQPQNPDNTIIYINRDITEARNALAVSLAIVLQNQSG